MAKPPQSPADIPAAYARAVKLMERGKLREAHGIFHAITRLRPRTAEAHWQIGRIAMQVGDYRAAVEALARAQKIKPREPVVLREYAAALASLGDIAAQVPLLRSLLAVNSGDVAARSDLAIALQQLGRFEEAEAELRRCIAEQPLNGTLYRLLVSGRKIHADDPIIAEMEQLCEDPALRPVHRANLDFALAKALEDAKDYTKVWPHLKRGNDALARLSPYVASQRGKEVTSIIEACDGIDYATPALEPDPGFAPVFVTGIPRSGTTLAEQIIGSHSAATAIGEAREFGQAVSQFLGAGDRRYRPLDSLAKDQLLAMRKRLEELYRRRFSFGAVCVDKSVQTWHFIGLIRWIMPNARVIVMQRDPRDNLLSIYKNVFAEGTHKYAYRVEDMVDYYKSHLKVMDFWRERAAGLFSEMSYEALVADPETRARELVDAAGLAWEDQCLEFYKSKRQVTTLSIAQVRQPIYQTSARAWERYGNDIAPLIAALEKEGLLPDDA